MLFCLLSLFEFTYTQVVCVLNLLLHLANHHFIIFFSSFYACKHVQTPTTNIFYVGVHKSFLSLRIQILKRCLLVVIVIVTNEQTHDTSSFFFFLQMQCNITSFVTEERAKRMKKTQANKQTEKQSVFLCAHVVLTVV